MQGSFNFEWLFFLFSAVKLASMDFVLTLILVFIAAVALLLHLGLRCYLFMGWRKVVGEVEAEK